MPSASDLLLLQGGRQGLLQFFGLALVSHDQRVQIRAAPDLELGRSAILLDLDRTGILAARNLQELADLCDLLRHDDLRSLQRELIAG
eukprot:CAMPEP_0115404988 /NCGR_PEP_ID=MMETSP0271-20121206/17700_1 /TAXON_ID=71861 /ORGANISM="Scrippsiella trochoidea, Strain CCMP3099" /LENGTH=87 /DNA_ID=CAMNT_0002828977 /DNA_START=57 /DNA_END=317 /DNA_ORIENTATION=+